MNGFAVFIGFIWTVTAAAVIALCIGMSVATLKDDYAKSGFMEHRGQYYSVKPAVLRAEPVQ